MVGSFVKKCTIVDTIKSIELNENSKEFTYKLIHIQGIAKGAGAVLDSIYEIEEISDEKFEQLTKTIESKFKEKLKKVVKDIQEVTGIGNKFFIHNINKNIINVFDLSYDEFLENNKILISEDLTKIIYY
ncbi:hypothetical protein [Clostridium sp. FP1]|uniref:hypothetical protein n=1 Tax=Clostridium sp. FP1 TaxID=2724076 RepID=UPI0013E99E59|nr:hypothetical protein [Clostridium sp. FP1]MBZ9635533.1 hypothetical protein [Clostridium sp. FP1]